MITTITMIAAPIIAIVIGFIIGNQYGQYKSEKANYETVNIKQTNIDMQEVRFETVILEEEVRLHNIGRLDVRKNFIERSKRDIPNDFFFMTERQDPFNPYRTYLTASIYIGKKS